MASQINPIVVDLDGTLIKTDMLFESANQFITQNPLRFWQPFVWLMRGRPYLKEQLAQRYYQRLIGRRLQVLVEPSRDERPGYVRGTSCRYAPVELPAGVVPYGQFVEVVARRVVEGHIEARPHC